MEHPVDQGPSLAGAPAPAADTASPLSRVAVALDSADPEEIRRWAAFFGPRVGVLKVGLEAFVRWGPPVLEEVRAEARGLFLDLKLHDIPNTVAGAVRAARELGVDLLSVHAAGGPAMLDAAVEAAGGLRLLAVTLLTHLDAAALAELDLGGDGRERVRRWAAMARAHGCAGVVCSPHEAELLRRENPRPFALVTPGIRFDGPADDQRRVATPEAALAAGSDLLVIGRPLTRADDPGRALAELEARLVGAAAGRPGAVRP